MSRGNYHHHHSGPRIRHWAHSESGGDRTVEDAVISVIVGCLTPPDMLPVVPNEHRMRREASRLQTYATWPDSNPVSPRDLARAGFYYLGPSDQVQCFCCRGVLRCWEAGDQPQREHTKYFPSCPFVQGREVGNVPCAGGRDAVDGQILGQLNRLPGEEEDEEAWQAMSPEMMDVRDRLATFHNWPSYVEVTPDVLAQAGFFYTGHGDSVKCFHCDGGLRNWERGDDAWREHAKWFPRCAFLVQSMGLPYVRSVQETLHSSSGSMLFHDSWSPQSDSRRLEDRSPGSPSDSPGDQQDLLQSSIARGALRMGFDRNLVASLIESRFLLVGTPYRSVSDLVHDLVQAEEDRQAHTTELRRRGLRGGSRLHTDVRMCVGISAVRMITGGSCGTRASNQYHGFVGIHETPAQRASTAPQPPKEPETTLSTEEQLRRLKEEKICKVCMDKDVSMVFVPCGHLVVCMDCAPNLRHCPICREPIRGSVRAFMS